MHLSLWVLAGVTILVNAPSILVYGIPEARRWRADRERAAAALYVTTRSAAIVVATAIATALCSVGLDPGWLLAIGMASALVQLFDIPVAAFSGARSVTVLAAVFAAVQAAAVVVAWVLVM